MLSAHDGVVESDGKAAQGCVSKSFVPVVEHGAERFFAPERRQHRAQDRRHPQERGQAPVKADTAKRSENHQNGHPHAEANDDLGRLQLLRRIQIRKLRQDQSSLT